MRRSAHRVMGMAMLATVALAGVMPAAAAQGPAPGDEPAIVVTSSTRIVRGESTFPVTMAVTNLGDEPIVGLELAASIPSDDPADIEVADATFDGHRWFIPYLRAGATATLRYTPL